MKLNISQSVSEETQTQKESQLADFDVSLSRRFSQRLRALKEGTAPFGKLQARTKSVLSKFVDKKLIFVCNEMLPDHGTTLYDVYRLPKIENVSV